MPSEAIKSAARTLLVFEHFDRIQRAAGVMELAEALEMPRSSAAALVSSLVQMGYLSHDRVARSYMPTMKLAQMGRWVDAALMGDDRDVLVPLLHDVARKADETVVLGVQDDLFAQYVHVELAHRPVLYFQRAGARRPITNPPCGRRHTKDGRSSTSTTQRALCRTAITWGYSPRRRCTKLPAS